MYTRFMHKKMIEFNADFRSEHTYGIKRFLRIFILWSKKWLNSMRNGKLPIKVPRLLTILKLINHHTFKNSQINLYLHFTTLLSEPRQIDKSVTVYLPHVHIENRSQTIVIDLKINNVNYCAYYCASHD